MSGFLHTQGCTKVGYEESMWQATSNGHQILLASHIDDFIISCAHRPTLDAFRDALLARFDDTTDGAIQTYLGCEIERDMSIGTTTLSQKHYAEDILRTYGFWGSLTLTTMLPPHTRLSKDDCDPTPEKAFHLRYHGIVGSLGYLVNMTRPDLAFAYSVGMFVDSEIVSSTSYGKTRVFINKTLSTETAYQQDLINRDLLSTRLIRGKVGAGMWCGNCNSTSG
jgi:hypothetical protein